MKNQRKILWLLLVTILIILAGCSKIEKEKTEILSMEEDTIQIGMTFDSFVIERWQRDRDVFVSAAKELGAEVNVQNANGDPNEQITQVEYFIKKKMDVIVIIPVDSGNLTEVVEKAKKEGIKVIAYDRLLNHAGEDLYISFDNEQVGRMMGEALVEAMPEAGNLIMIQGPTTDHNVSMVYEGFMQAIEGHGIQMIGSINAEGWKPEKAFEFLDGLDGLEEVQGVMCGNDSLAGQAIRALSMQRLAGEVAVVGQDADLEACQRIVEGTQTMTVYKPIEKLAKKAAECAVLLAKNQTIEDAETISDGSNEIPYVKIEPIKVTKDNMDEVIIDGGFHLREEVYLNVED